MVVKRKNVAKTSEVARTDDFFEQKEKQRSEKKTKRGCGWGSCLGIIIILVFVLFLLGLGLISSTGLVKVPIISAVTYGQDPQPVRVVTPADQTVEDVFAGAVNDGMTIRISESQLTRLLQQPSDTGQLTFKQSQVAIESDRAEIYSLAGDDSQLVIRADLIPDGNDLIVDSIRLGYLKLPTGLAQRLIRLISGEDLSLLGLLEKYNVSSIEIEPGNVVLGISDQAQEQILEKVDLGELTSLSTLEGKSLLDLKNNTLTNTELKALSQSLESLPAEAQKLITPYLK
ncbi:hypothetical protein KC644_02170 [Candidatus Berkelbacteria bacterium]|nr:hypothetical protein [Candidatus Berkelbacteria bacterium]